MYIASCKICQANKKPSQKPRAPLGSLQTGGILDVLATDFI